MGETYVYAFIRQDLSLEDQMVQLGHACLEAGQAFYRPASGLKSDAEGLGEGAPDVANLIVFGVADFIQLERARMKMQANDIRHHAFFEPDPGADGASKGWTAFATEPVTGERRKVFRNYKLWKASAV